MSNLFFDEKALELFEPLFDESIEFYPSSSEIKKYFCINIVEGLENLWDREKTKFKELSSDPFKVLKFTSNIYFYEDLVKNKHIFRINEKYPFIYVSDTFKNKYEENKLTGIAFELVWDSKELTNTLEEKI